jgi:hypothetical protein
MPNDPARCCSTSHPALLAPQVARHTELFISDDFQAPRVHQASAGWEVEQHRAGSFGIDYLFARGDRLPRPVNINATAPPLRRAYRRIAFQSNAESIYHGVTVHTRARLLQQLFYNIAYTASRSDETPQWPPTTLRDYWQLGIPSQGSTLQTFYPGNNDQRHHLAMAAIYDTSLLAAGRQGLSKRLLEDWQYTLVYTRHTGERYSGWVNGDLNGDLDPFNDQAPDTINNQFRQPSEASLDARAARRFRIGGTAQLALMWEAFNLTNRPNYSAVDSTIFANTFIATGVGLVHNPRFGEPTRQRNGRVMQLAARLTF